MERDIYIVYISVLYKKLETTKKWLIEEAGYISLIQSFKFSHTHFYKENHPSILIVRWVGLPKMWQTLLN